MTAAMLIALLSVGMSTAQPVRTSLGQYAGWGAFRADPPAQCWAVAEPAGHAAGAARPFVAIASWPYRRIAGQLHVRLRGSRPGQSVTLRIGDRRFLLLAGPADAWANDMREDSRIIAAMRRGEQMAIDVKDAGGRHYTDRYPLAGAASAIDAAAVGCLR